MRWMRHYLLGLVIAALAFAPLSARAASSSVYGYPTAGSFGLANQIIYCPIATGTTTGTDYKCTPAQIAAYLFGLVSGDVTMTGGGAATVGKIGGVSVAFGGAFTTTGASTPTLAFPGSGTPTYTLPATSATLAGLGIAQAWSANQTYGAGNFILTGASGCGTFTAGVLSGTGVACGTSGVGSLGNASADTSLTLTGTGSGPYTGTVTAKINLSNNFVWAGAHTFAEVLGSVAPRAGTTDTLAATDCGTEVVYSSSSAVTVTIPNTLPAGCNISVQQIGTAKVSVNGSAVTPATLRSPHSYTGTNGQYTVIGINVYSNVGGTSALATLTGDGS